MALLRASLARNSCSARRCSVTSRKTSTTPISLPAASRIGAAAVVDGPLRPVPGDQDRVVRQPDDDALPQHLLHRVLDRLAGLLVEDGEHRLQRLPWASSGVHPVNSCGHAVEERHPPLVVGGDDRIADGGERDRQPLPLLVQPLLGGLPLDPHGDLVGHRRHRLQGRLRQRAAGEHRHDAHEPVVHDERVSGEGDHALPLRPLLVAHTGVAHDGVGQVRLPLLGDQADLVLADRDPAVRAVQVRVHPGAGPQFQDVLGLVRASRRGRTPRPGASPTPRRSGGASPPGRPPGPAPPRPPHSGRGGASARPAPPRSASAPRCPGRPGRCRRCRPPHPGSALPSRRSGAPSRPSRSGRCGWPARRSCPPAAPAGPGSRPAGGCPR